MTSFRVRRLSVVFANIGDIPIQAQPTYHCLVDHPDLNLITTSSFSLAVLFLINWFSTIIMLRATAIAPLLSYAS
jgi:hypothetical protein